MATRNQQTQPSGELHPALIELGRSARHSRPLLFFGLASLAIVAIASPVSSHVYVARNMLAGAYPPYPGSGWLGEAYLSLPEKAVDNLLSVEPYVRDLEPDFTFRTTWIDFPAGPKDSVPDSDLSTIGDFLNDYVTDVSDPSKLDEPMSHFFLRFTGYVKVRLSDETRIRDFIGLPVWVDFANMGYDGYRAGTPPLPGVGGLSATYYRVPDVNLNDNPWTHFGPNMEVLGLYPIEVTYFNRYDPNGELAAPLAGIELYGFHAESDKFWPAGQQMFHEVFGFGRLVPPSVIYQAEDVQPLRGGDFDGDTDLDLLDYQWLQICGDPTFIFLPAGCDVYDLDATQSIDASERAAFLNAFDGPVMPREAGGP